MYRTMGENTRKRLQLVLTVLLPGSGHILSGRVSRGVILWALFLAAILGRAACVVVLNHDATSDRVLTCLTVAAAGVWAHAIVDFADLAYGLGRQPDADEVDALFRSGMVHYIRDELDEAAAQFTEAAKLTRRNPDAHINLAHVQALQGDLRAAQRSLRRCARFDEEGKWTDDANTLLENLKRD